MEETHSLTWNNEIGWLLEIMAYSAPNGYALISGYVSYGKKQRYSSIIYRTIQVTFYTVVATALFLLVGMRNIGVQSIVAAVFPVQFSVYWYFTAFFCMWFFIPILNLYVEKTNQKLQKEVIFWLLMIYSILPTLFHNDFSVQNWGYSSIWLAILYVLGAYIRKYGLQKIEKHALKVYACSVFLTWLSKIIIEIGTYKLFGAPRGGGYLIQYTSPFVVMCAVSLLAYFSRIELNGTWTKIVRFFSPLTFGAYLVQEEPLIRERLIMGKFRYLAYNSSIIMLLKILLFAAVIWFLGSIIDWLRTKLFRGCRIKELSIKIEKMLTRKMKFI